MIKISINPNHTNKMPQGLSAAEIKSWWRDFNGGFVNVNLPTTEKLISLIKDGYAYTAQHNGYRKADNFICGQHIGLDFDVDGSFISVLKDDFIRDNAAFIHTTASHTIECPKSRVIFILETHISNVNKYSLLTHAFADAYNQHADQSCKDPVRLFFGAKDCDVFELGNILTLQRAADIVLPFAEKEEQKKREEANKRLSLPGFNGNSVNPDRLKVIENSFIDAIMSAPNGQKWYTLVRVGRTWGGYVGGGYFDESYAKTRLLNAIASRNSTKDIDNAKEAIEWSVSAGKSQPIYLEEDVDPLLSKIFT